MGFDIQCRVGAAEIGIFTQDGAVGFACIFEKRSIRGTQLKVVTDHRDIVPFAVECGHDRRGNMFVSN